jgi:hypothetical protein
MNENNPANGYDALSFDGLERRGNYRFIAFREDILHALDKKEAAAIIFQIVYRWQTEYKRSEVLKKIEERKKSGQKPFTPEEIEDMMFVYMSYNDFVRESGGALGYNTVIRTLKYLIEEKKVLIQRENHDPRFGDYEYSINKEVARQLLKSLPVDPAFAPKMPKKKVSSTQMGTLNTDSTQMGTPAQRSTQMGIGSTQMGIEVYPFGSTSQELTRTHRNEGTNANNSTNLDASHSSALSLTSFSEEDLLAELNRRERERLETATATSSKPTQEISSPNQRNTDELDPSRLTSMFSPEEQRIHSYWQELGFEEIITPKLKEHWGKLVKSIQTFQQFKSLYDHTKLSLKGAKDETVYPGNLVKCLNGWKQKQMSEPEPEKTKNKAKQKITREYLDAIGY